MLSRLIDIVFSVLVIFLIVVITVALWNALHGTDKRVENQYNLVGDMLQGVIESPSEGVLSHRQFIFNFEIDSKGATTFDGTIFGISSDGSWTTPIPSLLWFPDPSSPSGLSAAELNNFIKTNKSELSLSYVDRTCLNAHGKPACLCLSDVPLTKQADLAKAINGIYTCRAFSVPQGKSYLVFDFETLQQQGGSATSPTRAGADKKYPVVYLVKQTGGCDEAHLQRISVPQGFAVPSRENSVCVYASLQPDFSP